MSTSIAAAVAVGLLLGGGVAYLATRMALGSRIQSLQARLEQLTHTHTHANEMLLQARRQAEAVQKELELARRNRTVPRVPVIAAPAGPSQEIVVNGTGFAETELSPNQES